MKKVIAYIIKSNFSFYEKIFTNSGLNANFNFLASTTCYSDLICSGISDVNVYNGRFHLAAKLQYTSFYSENFKNGKYNIPGLAKVRTKKEFEKYGKLEKAFESNGIRYNKRDKAYVNHIGEINYSSKCHFHSCFESQYLKARKLIVASEIVKGEESSIYGLAKNQCYSSIPFFIGKNLKLDIIYNKSKNKIIIGGKTIHIMHRLKVSVTPMGLLNISITYSLTSNSILDSKDLILIQKIVEEEHSIVYKKKLFKNYNLFYDFIKLQFEKALFEKLGGKESIDLGNTFSMNLSVSNKFVPTKKEIIGILDLDLNYEYYNKGYKRSHSSVFGKYVNDSTLILDNRLVYIFDERWKYKRTKPLFYWAFSDVFFSLYVNRKLLHFFSEKGQVVLRKSPEIMTKEDVKFIDAINEFVLSFEQYNKLSKPVKHMFYKFSEKVSLEYNKEIELLKESLRIHYSTSSNNFIDYFTINPNFMGLGVNFNKIIEKINRIKLK